MGWLTNQNIDAIWNATHPDQPPVPTKQRPAIAPVADAENPCPDHLPWGIPGETPKANDLVVRDIYCLSNNGETKFADWVAYRLTPEVIDGQITVDRRWQPDPALDPKVTLEPEDFSEAHNKLGTDRGHQAPLSSFKGRDWRQTNYLSNITPQTSDLNQGAWRGLEEYVRDLVWIHGEVFVITGTSYHRPMPQLPGADEKHQVPAGYWKIILTGQAMESYFFEQGTPKGTDFELGKTTLTEIEGFSGLDFTMLRNNFTEATIPGLD